MNKLYRVLWAVANLAPAAAIRIEAGVRTAVRVLWNATFAFFTEEALIRASSLAFTTLVSLVPLLTVALHVMNFYGISAGTRSEMEDVLAQYLLPTQSGAVVALVANAASDVTQNVGALGLLSFCVTLVLMARELEGHVLKICHKRATWWTSALHYAAFVILAPTGAVFAFLVLHPLAPMLEALPAGLSHLNYPFILAELVVVLLLRAFSDYALSWRASAFGAIAAGFAASASWKACALYFAHSASVSAYGALSCIPAFMLWVFVAWCCMLFGVQVAAKAQKAFSEKCVQRQE
jgi:membrane protein